MLFGSLFAGIGGFDLGLERAGMTCAWQVEIDPFCQRVLAKHWPNVERYGDVRKCGRHNLRAADVVVGGFPCQPHSVAGKRRGKADDRNLWPEYHRIVAELKPRWVVAENVPGIITTMLDEVLSDLESEGYTIATLLLPAMAFDAPHRRERVFVIANRDGKRVEGRWEKEVRGVAAFSWCEGVRRAEDLRGRSDIPFPLIRRTNDGISRRLDAIGNAVVPQVAEWIGRIIVNCDHER